MKQPLLISTIAIGLLAGGGCASQAAADRDSPTAGPPTQAIALPASAGPGKPKEVKILSDDPGLKLATIALRQGTVLPEHAAPVAVTIMALDGAGTLIVGGKRFRLDREHAIVLGAHAAHVVEPDAGTDMLLLIHHLGDNTGH